MKTTFLKKFECKRKSGQFLEKQLDILEIGSCGTQAICGCDIADL